MMNLSKDQLSKLVLHNMQISTILLEACLFGSENEKEPDDLQPVGEDTDDLEIDLYEDVPWKQDGEDCPVYDAVLEKLCGQWVGISKKQAPFIIFKDHQNYLLTFCKKVKGSYGFFPITHEGGIQVFNTGKNNVYLTHYPENDRILLSPGGTYTRVTESPK